MNRRESPRKTQRVQIRFWRQGGERSYPGYALNVSARGMFIGTSYPLPTGSRLRAEVVDPDRGFVVEGVVVHSHRVAPELQRVRPSGMGVRFLGFDELLGELAPVTSPGRAPSVAPRVAPRSERVDRESFPVVYRSAREIFAILDRDLVHGGLFVRTQEPATVGSVITVEVRIESEAAIGEPPLRLPARVVHRFAGDGNGSPAATAGMGVELLDPQVAIDFLRGIAERLDAGTQARPAAGS